MNIGKPEKHSPTTARPAAAREARMWQARNSVAGIIELIRRCVRFLLGDSPAVHHHPMLNFPGALGYIASTTQGSKPNNVISARSLSGAGMADNNEAKTHGKT
ncbi:hypothetical protein [Ectothiorhodospira lacustris]|uniref:hypothetical protein n=1 Tax=Ectothiorhodospira lacustris TaxID=2899127 RepID=UPI001EE8595F|nr:hypothetical protein [Ectothiorhodospira lacustris]MCG5511423.1 hypothetical protein [Ectothiorhodospira lacustris]MCG5523176.1 hypothetical protein [Ectothiorhodospira lacustris]